MAMQNLRELFVFKLNQTISYEKSMQKLTHELASDAQMPQVKEALQRHESTLGTQISHLEECVSKLGGQVSTVENYTIEGMLKEVGEFRRQNPSVEAFDLYRLGTLIKLGFGKVGDYRVLAWYGRTLGEQSCVNIIEGDLKEIEDNAKKMVDTLGQVAQQWGGGRGPSIGMR